MNRRKEAAVSTQDSLASLYNCHILHRLFEVVLWYSAWSQREHPQTGRIRWVCGSKDNQARNVGGEIKELQPMQLCHFQTMQIKDFTPTQWDFIHLKRCKGTCWAVKLWMSALMKIGGKRNRDLINNRAGKLKFCMNKRCQLSLANGSDVQGELLSVALAEENHQKI